MNGMSNPHPEAPRVSLWTAMARVSTRDHRKGAEF